MERGGTRQSRAPRRKRKFQPPSPWQEAHAIDREMVLARVTRCLNCVTAHWDSASTCMVMTARHLYIIFTMLYKEGEKSTDVNVGVLSAASALSECLVVVSRGGN